MASNTGWLKLWRKLTDNPMWLAEPFTKGQAWVDLLLLAQVSDNVGYSKGQKMEFKAGTVYKSTLELADRWKWSRGKVTRYIECLKNDAAISVTSDTTHGTAITIVGWEKYQGRSTANKTTNGTAIGTADGHQNGHNIRSNKKYPTDTKRRKEYGAAPLEAHADENDDETRWHYQ